MCALPSAQLGSMPGLSVPSFVPTVQVQKEPKSWERALLAILTQAGATAVGQGVQNAMSNDNAAEFGGTPRSGFGKLLAPQVSDQDAAGRRRLAMEQTGIDSAERRDRLNRVSADTRSNKELTNATLNRAADLESRFLSEQLAGQRTDQLESGRERMGVLEEKGRNVRSLLDAAVREKGQKVTSERDTMIDNREAPNRAAMAREHLARAEQTEHQSRYAKRIADEVDAKAGGGKSGGKPSANVAKFGAAAAASLSPEDAAVVEMIRAALSAGQQTPTPSGPAPGTTALTPEQLLTQLQGFMR